MTTYYHFRQDPRKPGDVIDPTMRAILETYGIHVNVNPWRLATELAMEERRLVLAPKAVSRMDSNFVFLTEDDAFRQVYKMGGSKFLYEVEFADLNAPTFKADFDLISTLFTSDGRALLPKVKAMAVDYWNGVIAGTPELLTSSPLRVVKIARTFA
jgi:hypothetical protein